MYFEKRFVEASWSVRWNWIPNHNVNVFFLAVLSNNKWEPVQEAFDFLYFVDNNIGGVNGAKLREDEEEDQDERDQPPPQRLRSNKENAEEEKYDTIGDVTDDKTKESEPQRKHDEF